MDTSIARRTDGKLIHAQQGIDKTLPFYCPGCQQEVYAATEGKIQRPHFRHKSSTESNLKGCSKPEHYIHWITKELFAEFYQDIDCLQIQISTTLFCAQTQTCVKDIVHEIDLKAKYPYILVEQYDKGFKPDCMLYNDFGENLYLEVKFTHAVSQDKIDTGIPIIELHVTTEKDIDKIIEKGKIEYKTSQYKIYNKSVLLPQTLTFDCKGKCLRKQQDKQRLVQSFQKESKVGNVRYKSPENSYWGGIYANWAKWKNELPKRDKSASMPKQYIEDEQNNSKTENRKNPTLKQTSFDFED